MASPNLGAGSSVTYEVLTITDGLTVEELIRMLKHLPPQSVLAVRGPINHIPIRVVKPKN